MWNILGEQAKVVLDDVLERLPEMPNLDEIRARAEEPSPYTMVALQARTLPASLPSAVPTPANSSHCSVVTRGNHAAQCELHAALECARAAHAQCREPAGSGSDKQYSKVRQAIMTSLEQAPMRWLARLCAGDGAAGGPAGGHAAQPGRAGPGPQGRPHHERGTFTH